MEHFDVVVVGGGAAGFFGAIQCAEHHPALRIAIIEKSEKLLSKVKISGGGRCNVTHACFDPAELVQYYPRGGKALLGPFHRFSPTEMIEWLEAHQVPVKTEPDGRIFPQSNQSETIVQCFLQTARQCGISVITGTGIQQMKRMENGEWELKTGHRTFISPRVLVASGSSPAMWKVLERAGCKLIPPVPSLFTFNCQHHLLHDLQGLSVPKVLLKTQTNPVVETSGALLITHWGISGPAVLKASAWAARLLHQVQYQFNLVINWTGLPMEDVIAWLQDQKQQQGGKKCKTQPGFNIPRRLWERLVTAAGLENANWADVGKQQLQLLANLLGKTCLPIQGKSTFKDEFVTCGGIDIHDVHFTTMEYKQLSGLYLAGEVLDIDAVTGGFNFQAAWTTAYIAGRSIAESLHKD